MSFRRRMVLLAAGAVAAAVVLASVVVYVVTRDELLGQTDASLREKVAPGAAAVGPDQDAKLSPAEVAKLSGKARSPARIAHQDRRPSSSGRVARTGSPSQAGASAARRRVHRRSRARPGNECGKRLSGTSRGRAGSVRRRDAGRQPPGEIASSCCPAPTLGGATGYVQLLRPTAASCARKASGSLLPVTAAARAVAAGRRPAFFSDATVAGTRVRDPHRARSSGRRVAGGAAARRRRQHARRT